MVLPSLHTCSTAWSDISLNKCSKVDITQILHGLGLDHVNWTKLGDDTETRGESEGLGAGGLGPACTYIHVTSSSMMVLLGNKGDKWS
jgi:hypothetical protein